MAFMSRERLRHVEARAARGLERQRLVHVLRARHQREMKGGELRLPRRGDRHARDGLRIGALDRPFLEHDAQILVALDKRAHGLARLAAEGAVVVVELDHRDVAFGIAGDEGIAVLEERRPLGGHDFFYARGLSRAILRVELLQRLHDHLGMLQKIVANDRLDLRPLGGRGFARGGGRVSCDQQRRR